MATYQMRAPDGNTYRIEGPEGATDEQVRAEIINQNPGLIGAAPKPSPLTPTTKPSGAEPDQRSWFQKYVSAPATTATAKTLAGVGDMLMMPADIAASAARTAGLMGPDTLSALGLDKREAGLAAAEKAAEAPARFIVPQSGTEAGIMAGTMLAGGPLLSAAAKAVPALAPVAGLTGAAGANWLQRLAPPAARIAGATAGGAVGGGVTGEGAGKGALIGAGSAITGEGLLTLAGKLVRSLPYAATAIDKKMAKEVGQAIEDISAPLKGARNAYDLQQLAVEGETRLGAAKEKVVSLIERSVKKPFSVPSLGPDPMTLKEANRELTELGKRAFRGQGDAEAVQQYRRANEEIRRGLDAVDPTGTARGLFSGIQDQHRKGLGLLEMLTPKPTFVRGPLGVRLRTPTLQEYIANPATQQELRSRLSEAEFKQLTDVLTRGGELGTKDALKSLYPTTLTGGLLGSGLGIGGGLGFGLSGGGLAGLPLLAPNVLNRYAGRAPLAPGQLPRTLADLATALGILRQQPPQAQR
ncbi:MAG TPA: hypothetical protein VGX03_15070 [Candidatus Binatia bacterium]|jgi:hypothetical protein|nr:hypothetical protein [Candidatus Binatia bacterium]